MLNPSFRPRQRALPPVLVASLLVLSVPASPFVQDTASLPPSPWWALVVVAPLVGLTAEIVRRFIIAYLKKLDAKRQAAITEKLRLMDEAEAERKRTFDEQEAERKRTFDLAMARLQGENAATAALTSSILELSRSNASTYAGLLLDRQQASAERAQFSEVLTGNTDGLSKNTDGLGDLNKTVSDAVLRLDEFFLIIGQSPDKRTMFQVMTSLAESLHGLSERLSQLPVLAAAPSADGSHHQEVHAHETPAS